MKQHTLQQLEDLLKMFRKWRLIVIDGTVDMDIKIVDRDSRELECCINNRDVEELESRVVISGLGQTTLVYRPEGYK